MPYGVFVTGTSTDVGKSIVMATLQRAFVTRDICVVPVKAVQTGVAQCAHNTPEKNAGDATIYRDALQSLPCTTKARAMRPQTLCQFSLPASPHYAAAQEGERLTVREIVNRIHILADQHPTMPLLIEGAGGLLVPLNESEYVIDIARALHMPLIIVVNNALGALNHALLTVEAAQRRDLQICAIVMNDRSGDKNNTDTGIAEDNIHFLKGKFPHILVCTLPYFHGIDAQWHEVAHALGEVADACKKLWQHSNQAVKHNDALLAWDKEHLWHPYTSATQALPVYPVARAQGKYIELHNGIRLLDGMASWWCAIHGYSHPRLVAAAQEQAARLSHVMFGGLTHEPAVRAAQKLLALMTPLHEQTQCLAHGSMSLSRVFWADSGSVAVEVALKMAVQYQHARQHTRRRTRILTPRGGYYGDTQGAMSVCDPITGMHTLFANTLPQQCFIEKPSCAFHGTCTQEHLAPLEKAFAEYGQDLAACIIEPIVQGAGGMHFYHPHYLQRMRELCTQYEVLLICDEIATGFGRTGKMFASQWAQIVPDICCVGKALTGGFMNLAATVCTEHVAQGICAHDNVFMHGPTFMANPLACAVASTSMDILTDSPWCDRVARIEKALWRGLAPCAKHEDVHDVRVLGAIGVIETKRPVNMAKIQNFFVRHGVWIRPFGTLLYVMPPYIFEDEDIDSLTSVLTHALQTRTFLS